MHYDSAKERITTHTSRRRLANSGSVLLRAWVEIPAAAFRLGAHYAERLVYLHLGTRLRRRSVLTYNLHQVLLWGVKVLEPVDFTLTVRPRGLVILHPS